MPENNQDNQKEIKKFENRNRVAFQIPRWRIPNREHPTLLVGGY